MRRDENIKADELNRPEGNDLVSNYDKHDVGEQYIAILCESRGLRVENWGIDMRHDDGDGVIFDDKMDLKVYDGEDFVGIIEVKTKTNPRYIGSMNARHLDDYKDVAGEHEVPVFIVFLHVDGERVLSSRWVHVTPDTIPLRAFTWPDGNRGVEVAQTHTTAGAIETFL